MNGLDKIINEIALDADAEAERITADAKARAEKLISRARERETEILQEAQETAAEESRKTEMRAEAAGKAEEKRAVLREKQSIIDEVLSAAAATIKDDNPDKYFGFMLRLLDKYAEERPGEIILSERAKTWITPEFSRALTEKGLKISEKTGDFSGGFILVYGEIEENCTLEALIASEHDRLHDIISKFLFG
ncbi:MAG: V-type ATP synthase subunit E [Candidatus Ornithomonoglobus sp.]